MAPRISKKTTDDKPTKAVKPSKTPQAGRLAPDKPTASAATKPSPKATDQTKADTVRLKDLVEAVAAATGTKKPAAKASIEAVLVAMGDALKSGSVLVLPPLGKLRVAKTAGTTLTLKLRLADAPKAGGKPLADVGEDS
ncbi:HU family DNA-binding protein [Tabrizicola sp.]|uniref:HU family DNA-binding protein n=1 Tax=Tabrizicola sp. TaxID=2005166 RepID=UPI0026179499|nr:HU family DNA-binding protein [Tabrizicola sp.]MDM7931138.1 HU family DNA-binding protein [Tabrizicola sp.]